MIRIASLALVLGVAAVFVGEARASFEPRLYVSHATMSLGSAGTTSIRLALANPVTTEALASVRLVVPRSYAVNLPAATPSEWPEVGKTTAVTYNGDVLHGMVISVPSWSLAWQHTSR